VQWTTCILDETQAHKQKENIPTTIFKWQLGQHSWYRKSLQARRLGFEPRWGEIFHNHPDRPKANYSLLLWVLGLLATGKAARVWCWPPLSSAQIKQRHSYTLFPSVPSQHLTELIKLIIYSNNSIDFIQFKCHHSMTDMNCVYLFPAWRFSRHFCMYWL